MRHWIAWLSIFFSLCLQGQTTESSTNPEAFLRIAKCLAEKQDHKEAAHILEIGLEKFPLDHDLLCYQTRVHLWQQLWPEADENIRSLQVNYPDSPETRELALKSMEWQAKWDSVLILAELFIQNDQDEEDLHFAKTRALLELGRYRKARKYHGTHGSFKTNFPALIRDHLQESKMLVSMETTMTNFREGNLDPWYMSRVALHHKGSMPWNARINYASRFGVSGPQVEVSAYPSLSKKTYMKIGAAYSTLPIFPTYRLETFLNRSIGKLALQTGMMGRWYDQGLAITPGIVVEYYHKQFYGSLKSEVHILDQQRSTAYGVKARLYFRQKGHIELNSGIGSYPFFTSGLDKLGILAFRTANVNVQWELSPTLITGVRLGVSQEIIHETLSREGLTGGLRLVVSL